VKPKNEAQVYLAISLHCELMQSKGGWYKTVRSVMRVGISILFCQLMRGRGCVRPHCDVTLAFHNQGSSVFEDPVEFHPYLPGSDVSWESHVAVSVKFSSTMISGKTTGFFQSLDDRELQYEATALQSVQSVQLTQILPDLLVKQQIRRQVTTIHSIKDQILIRTNVQDSTPVASK